MMHDLTELHESWLLPLFPRVGRRFDGVVGARDIARAHNGHTPVTTPGALSEVVRNVLMRGVALGGSRDDVQAATIMDDKTTWMVCIRAGVLYVTLMVNDRGSVMTLMGTGQEVIISTTTTLFDDDQNSATGELGMCISPTKGMTLFTRHLTPNIWRKFLHLVVRAGNDKDTALRAISALLDGVRDDVLELSFTTCTAHHVIDAVKECLPMIDHNHRLWEVTSREEDNTVGEMTEPADGGTVTVPIKRNHAHVVAHHLASGISLHLNGSTDTNKWSAHLKPIQDMQYAIVGSAEAPGADDFQHVYSPDGITVRALVKVLVEYETHIRAEMKRIK